MTGERATFAYSGVLTRLCLFRRFQLCQQGVQHGDWVALLESASSVELFHVLLRKSLVLVTSMDGCLCKMGLIACVKAQFFRVLTSAFFGNPYCDVRKFTDLA